MARDTCAFQSRWNSSADRCTTADSTFFSRALTASSALSRLLVALTSALRSPGMAARWGACAPSSASIARASAIMDSARWRQSRRASSVGANTALRLLCRILNHSIVCGHLQTNPARGIKLNPRRKLTRFLSREEVRVLHRVLDRHARARPSRARQADIIRLLLLTGCRKSEIRTLRWQDVDGDTLNLADAKTGPRRVFLNAPARAILERQPRSESACVFPSPKNSERPLSRNLALWRSVRKEAGIEDVRLHDLRHTCASMTYNSLAIMNLFISRLIPKSYSHRIHSIS